MAKNLFQSTIDAPIGSVPAPPAPVQNVPQKSFLSKAYHFLAQPAINLGEDISFLFPEQAAARQVLLTGKAKENYLQSSAYKNLMAQLPETPTTEKVLGDIGSTVLTGLSFMPGVGGLGLLAKAGTKVGWGTAALRATGLGAAYGAGFGATGAMSNKGTMLDVINSTVEGSIIGAPFGVGGEFAIKGLGLVAGKAAAPVGAAVSSFAEKHPMVQNLINLGRAMGRVMETDYGIIGQNFMKIYNKIDGEAQTFIGKFYNRLIQEGMIESPVPKWQAAVARFKTMAKITPEENNALWYMLDKSAPAAKDIPPVDLKTNPSLQRKFEVADNIRKEYLASAQEVGVAKKDLTAEGYMTHIAPLDEKKFSIEKNGGELLGKKGSIRNEYIMNSVNDGYFKTPEESAMALDGWLDFFKKGGRVDENNKWVQNLIATGKAKSTQDAIDMTKRYILNGKTTFTPRASSLDFAREFDVPWYDHNVGKVLMAQGSDVGVRLAYARGFGPNDKKILAFSRELEKLQGHTAAQNFDNAVRKLTGQFRNNPTSEELSSYIRSVQAPKLTFAQILNLGQSLNTLLATDLKNLARGLASPFTNKGIVNAIESGAMSNAIIRENLAMMGGGKRFADSWMKWIGFNWTEKFNRTVAANAFEGYLKDQAAVLAKNPTNGLARWRVQELGLNPEEVVTNGLTKEMRMTAAYNGAAKTQFMSKPSDLPAFATSPFGKVVFQFKNYAYQQMYFLKDSLVKDLGYMGAPRNLPQFFRKLVILGTVFPMTGEVIQDIRSLVTGTTRPTFIKQNGQISLGGALTRYLDDLSNAGAWGLAIDFYNSATYGKILQNLAGPTIGTGAQVIEEGTSLLNARTARTRDTQINNLVKLFLQQTGVGKIPASYLMTKPSNKRESIYKTLQKLQKY